MQINPPSLIAILGASGSGKTQTAIQLAKELDAEIFSLDSLSIYQGIDILSAKPSLEEREGIFHYGMDVLLPDEPCNAGVFSHLLEMAIQDCQKPFLILVGGSSFYLKAILDGLSPMPKIPACIQQEIAKKSPARRYEELLKIDRDFAQKIHPGDTYRITRALSLYHATQMRPSLYFQTHPPKPFAHPIKLYAITTPREILRANIAKRSQMMLKNGGVDEVKSLLQTYDPSYQPFRAIGPKECLSYLRGEISLAQCEALITTHTCQLAKRQETFNRTQFENLIFLEKDVLLERILHKA